MLRTLGSSVSPSQRLRRDHVVQQRVLRRSMSTAPEVLIGF